MYYSITEARGTGSPMTLAVPPYLDKAHIAVYIDGMPTEAFAWINAQAISLTAPLNRLVRVVRRTSPGARLTQFNNGVPLPGQDLEVDSKQAFYLAQEAYDIALGMGTSGGALPGGVELTTQGILDLLNGQITPSQLELDLRESIALIKATASQIGSPAWLVAQEAAARAGAIQAEYDARVVAIAGEASNRAAAIAAERTLREDADGFLASQVSTVAAQMDGVNAAISSEQIARASADDSLASDIDAVVAYVDDQIGAGAGGLNDRVAAVETAATATASRVDGVEAQWTVKVQARSDGKKAIAGIGINATANTNVAQSEMVFLADKFTFVPSQADVNVIPQPILVMGLVNGVNTLVVPPSRYGDQLIEARMVVDGGIETRHLKVTGSRGTALNDDPSMKDASAWTLNAGSGSFVTLSDGAVGNNAFRSAPSAEILSRPIPTNPARHYRVRCRARRSSDASGLLYIGLAFADAAGANITGGGTYWYAGAAGASISTSWTEFTGEIVPPSNARTMRVLALANYSGTAGYMDVQDLQVAEMLDYSLVVAGGISADRIDTRGLTIKDAAGNVVFSATDPITLSHIVGLGAFAALNQITAGNITTYMANAAIGEAQIKNASIGNAQIKDYIESTNYLFGTAGRGWSINKSGFAEFNDVDIRGRLHAATGTFDGVLTAGSLVLTGQSLFKPSFAQASGVVAALTTTEQPLLASATVDVGATGTVLLMVTLDFTMASSFGGESDSGSYQAPVFVLRRNGTTIASWSPPVGGATSFVSHNSISWSDNPGTSATYTLWLSGSTMDVKPTVARRTLLLMGVTR